jgi:acetyl/propionyl-CoA carboxylase alpha subunit
MAETAVRAAAAAGYRNAGTVEFLVDRSNGTPDAEPFYFLEMNTRLQVEHPVTEQVTGVDLVHAQLLVASGEELPWSQPELRQRGHAIEARVYAEDPSNGFLPQAGRIQLHREPHMPGVRVDSGVTEGETVSVHFDPLLSKVIASAETRKLAVERLIAALRDYPILGIRTNIPFLLKVLDHPRFRAGAMDTGFLDEEGAALAAAGSDGIPAVVLAAVGAHRQATGTRPERGEGGDDWDPWARFRGWRG